MVIGKEVDMKRVVRCHDNVFGMSRVRTKYSRPEIRNLIPGFVYVSSVESGHGPRVKFDGGTSETNKKDTCPSMEFDSNGNCQVVLQSWMTRKNCPNAFSPQVVSNVKEFVRIELPVLLLMWFEHLDEATAYNYLQGFVDLDDIVEELKAPENISSLNQLDEYCRMKNLYSFAK